MRRFLVILAGMLLLSGAALAQNVVGSLHDLSAALPTSQQVCVFCHTPHQAGTSVDPLWNHNLSAVANYGVYASSTLDATPADIGGGTAVSNLCMSCHDGTIGIGALYNDPNITGGAEETPTNAATLVTGNANMGSDLTNDHPVNFTYDGALVTADGGLNDPTAAPIVDWLVAGTVQCSSCHEVHDDTNIPFLRATNVNSALCTTCHNK